MPLHLQQIVSQWLAENYTYRFTCSRINDTPDNFTIMVAIPRPAAALNAHYSDLVMIVGNDDVTTYASSAPIKAVVMQASNPTFFEELKVRVDSRIYWLKENL